MTSSRLLSWTLFLASLGLAACGDALPPDEANAPAASEDPGGLAPPNPDVAAAQPDATAKAKMTPELRAAFIASRQAEGGPRYRVLPAAEVKDLNARKGQTLAARNSANHFVTGFSAKNIEVASTTGDYSVTIEPARIGCEADLRPLPAAAPTTSAEADNRVEYQRGAGFSEWYVNGPVGLEQGFTLSSKPACDAPEGSARDLLVELSVDGLNPTMGEGGARIVLRDAEGNERLGYSDLYVKDARGGAVPASLAVQNGRIWLRIQDEGAPYPLTIDPIIAVQQQKLVPAEPSEWFGYSVDVSGTTAVVGAWGDDEHGTNSGSAYIFVKSGGKWVQEAKLVPSDGQAYDYFGFNVAISGDRVVVGAYGDDDKGTTAGAIYVYHRTSGVWSSKGKLYGSDTDGSDGFGYSVDIDGSQLIAGAYVRYDGGQASAGAAYVFSYDGTNWVQSAKLLAPTAQAYAYFGSAVSISGSYAIVGAYGEDITVSATMYTDAGAAYAFRLVSGSWTSGTQLTAITPEAYANYGRAVANSGALAVIGAPYEDVNGSNAGAVYVREYACATICFWWSRGRYVSGDIQASDYFGAAVAVSGSTVVVGAYTEDPDSITDAGSAYRFTYSAGTLTQNAKVQASDKESGDYFGISVAIDAASQALLVGSRFESERATDAGAAYLFEGSTYAETAKLLPHDGAPADYFGYRVALSGDTAIVGAYAADDDDLSASGLAYVYFRSGGVWRLQAKLKSSNPQASAYFGISVGLSGEVAAVGATYYDDATKGTDVGAVFVFRRSSGNWSQEALLVPSDGSPYDYFGTDVALDGNVLVAGARGADPGGLSTAGAAYVFNYSGSSWKQGAKLVASDGTADDWFGYAVGVSGTTAIVGAPYAETGITASAGAAYLFDTATGSLIKRLPNPSGLSANDFMGVRVAISGSSALVGITNYGSTDTGAGAFYTLFKGNWVFSSVQTPAGAATGNSYGWDVAINGSTAIIGGYYSSYHLTNAGDAAIYYASTGWTAQDRVVPLDLAASDRFGYGLAISGETVLSGAPYHDHLGTNSGGAWAHLLRLDNGEPCPGAFACASGFCVDGVCCKTACGGGVTTDCQSCNVDAASAGICSTETNTAHVCRAATDECDAAETCSGTSSACPNDKVKSSGTACTADTNPCTLDQCNGSSKVCQHPAGNAGTVCRAAADLCDVAETCTGSSTSCPTDGFASSSTVCRSASGECDVAEACPGNGPACPADGVKTSGTACTADALACSLDICDGTSKSCQHPPGNAGTVCRTTAGECDLAETCTGSSTACPTDAVKTNNTACTDDGNVCTQDVCNGSSVFCQHPAGNAGTVCRAVDGECDLAETCTGSSTSCPTDAVKANNTACTDDGNVCSRDICDGTNKTCQHPAGNSGTVCRASGGVCDPAETCSGTSTSCPTNVLYGSSVVCRSSSGVCDLAEVCSGSSAACPDDGFQPTSVQCRAASCDTVPDPDLATLAANCPGNAASCPAVQTVSCGTYSCNGDVCGGGCVNDSGCASGSYCAGGACVPKKGNGDVCTGGNQCITANCIDGVCCNSTCGGGATDDCQACNVSGSVGTCSPAPNTVVCRTSAGECDVAETCTGSSTTCPADGKKAANTSCTDDGKLCTTDVCNGTSNLCQHPAGNAGTVCRAANGVCDVAETCTGSSTDCPGDAFAVSTTVCRSSAGECDVAEYCTGTGPSCPSDGKKATGTACTADANPCTLDQCDGSSVLCLHPAGNAGTVCRAANGDCDVAETCSGSSVDCPTDAYKASGIQCRASAGECDVAETCTGTGPACPANGFVGAGTACSSDGNPCTLDQCNGTSATCQYPAGNAGALCRAASGECDVAESCTGTSTACPSDAFVSAGVSCSSDGNPCTIDQCNGAGVCAHPAGNAGALCRAAADECDLSETCTGSSTSCPTDAKKAAGTPCTADTNPCTLDQCNGTSVVCQHPAGNAGTVCRASSGVCDLAETCTGSSTTCPADGVATSGTLCRAINGDCDVAELCDGTNKTCPADGYASSSVQCRGASCDILSNVATLTASCPGTSASCPTEQTISCSPHTCSGSVCGTSCASDANCTAGNYCSGSLCVPKKDSGQACSAANQCLSSFCVDGVCCNDECGGGSPSDCMACNVVGSLGTCSAAPNTVTCRASAGECDLEEKCTGGSMTCPADLRKSNGTPCTADSQICTLDQCNGTSVDCQHPAGNAGTVCRSSAGVCDLVETCTGTSTTCPADGFAGTSTVCRASAGECDVEEKCTGGSASCPADQYVANNTACSSDGKICTVDVCNGSGQCIHPAGNAGTVCRTAAGTCDLPEQCDGAGTNCPTDLFVSTGTVCRAANASGCDIAETCSGSGPLCPVDAFVAAGIGCPDDGKVCTLDHCDGNGACAHPAGNAGTQCRPAAGVCDVAESCNGTSSDCPANGYLVGTECRAPSCTADLATLAEYCPGTSADCPPEQTLACAPNVCAGDVCGGGCANDGECQVGYYCASGVCTAKKALGVTCAGSNQCTSNFCIDGVCCNTECGGGLSNDCQACNVSGSLGTCGPAPNTVVCRASAGECDLADTCTGSSTVCPADAKKALDTPCSEDGNPCTRDVCDGTSVLCQYPAGNAGAVCRAATDVCDAAETCTGTSTACPTDGYATVGTVCRTAASECDLAEACTGSSAACPADGFKTAGASCSTDGNPCTVDQCDGSGGCTHPAGNAGTVCRAALGVCDIAETCNGTATACPVDSFLGSSTTCRVSAGECDPAETCNGSGPNCPADALAASGAPCSEDGNPCTADQCNGTSAACQHPAGNAGVLCRAADGVCDLAETCTGASTSCPPDLFAGSSVECSAPSCDSGSNVATLASACNGVSNACPAADTISCSPYTCSGNACAGGCTLSTDCSTGFICVAGVCTPSKLDGAACSSGSECGSGNCVDGVCCNTACGGGVTNDCQACNVPGALGTCGPAPATVLCRLATGECDAAEYCTGSSTACPADSYAPTGTECGDEGNPCTIDECNGTSATCQHTPGNAGAVCRAAAGVCDVAETCTGSSAACPSDGFATNAVVCRLSADECDVAETCSGSSAACPADAFAPAGSACSEDGNVCTLDQCSGTSAACQHPAGNAGTTCRAANGVCDVAETCTGTSTACPADAFLGTSSVCRASAGACDTAETCTGASATCPSDGFAPAGTSCPNDNNPCTVDQCNGLSAACQYQAGNQGTVCRAAANECDVAETCNGTDTACPANGYTVTGTPCTDDGNVCTVDQCSGTSSGCVHIAGNAGTICRAAASECDVAETCNGTSTTCPADAFQPSGAPCTADSLPCTVDQCNGAGACAHPAGNAGAVCRTAASECDIAEKCNGSSTTCPVDAFQPSGTACAADTNPCTLDQCNSTGTCTHPAGNAGAVCRAAASACDIAETCTGSGTQCPADGFKANGTSCRDDSVCNGSESCLSGVCTAGTPLNCDDGNQCTADACHPATGCYYTPLANGTACNDGSECSTTEECQSGLCTVTSGVDCNDKNQCTADVCDTGTMTCSNTNVPNGTACNDSDACTKIDTCQSGACIGTQPLNCDDGNPCTTDSCNPATGCENIPLADGTTCDDGNPCNGTETCKSGICAAGPRPNCDDGDPCTADTCQTGIGCKNIALSDGTSCSDGNVCNGGETCQAGICKAGTALNCDDGNPCTADACDPATGGCVNVPVADGIGCSDGNVCNGAETCKSGICAAGTPPNCDDADPCTSDLCDSAVGCVHVAADNNTPCNDNDVCTRSDTCQGGTCTGTNPISCDDGNPCTDDMCDADVGCTHTNVEDGTTCNDGNPCSGSDQCQHGVCRGTTGLVCDDENPCTLDSCNIDTFTCIFTNVDNGTACDDDDRCTVGDTCQSGVCVGGEDLNCADANVCTTDSCSAYTGCTRSANNGAPCSDGNPCTESDQCAGMVCTSLKSVLCVASDECHVPGVCDLFTGVCSESNAPDGTSCLQTGTCEAGVCTGLGGEGGAGGAGGSAGQGGVSTGGGAGQGGTAGLAGFPGSGGTAGGTAGQGGTAGTGASSGGVSGDSTGGTLGDGGPDATTDGGENFTLELQGCACRAVGEPKHRNGVGWALFGLLALAGGAVRRSRRGPGSKAA